MAKIEWLRHQQRRGEAAHVTGSGSGRPLARRLLEPFRRTRGALVAGLVLWCACLISVAGAATITEFAIPTPTYAAVSFPKPEGWVTDQAGLIDASTRDRLERLLTEVQRKSGVEIAVVTLPTLGGRSVEEVAVELFQAWGIGKKGKVEGLLLLVALKERKIRIEVGYGLEGTIPDGLAGEIIRDTITPRFRQGRFAEGIETGVDQIVETIARQKQIDFTMPQAPPPRTVGEFAAAGAPSFGAQPSLWEKYDAEAVKEYRQGHYAEAQKLLLAALKEAEAFGAYDLRLAMTLDKLAKVYAAQSQYAAAEPLYQRALAIWEKVVRRPDAPGVTTTLNNLAELYQAQGQYAAAEPLYKRAVAIKEKALGPEHPNVAGSLNNLARLHTAQGQYAAAEVLYKRALAIKEKALGLEHPAVATSLENYAALLRRMKRGTEAADLEARAQAIRVKLVQKNPTDKLFTARSVDYPDHPMWPGLDATVTEMQRDGRSSLFLVTQRKGLEGAGANGRFFFCSVSALASQRGFGYWANSEAVEDYDGNYILAAFLTSKDEKVRDVVGDQYNKYHFSEASSISFFRELCSFKP